MKVILTSIILLLASVIYVFSATTPEQLQDISVTIIAKGGQGSGIIKVRDGVSYVLTAGHVVSDNRHVRTVADSASNSTKIIVTYDDVMVVRDLIEDGRLVGSVLTFGEIIKYSDADFGVDVAVLKLRKHDFSSYSAKFYLDPISPAVGTELIHVGSMRGHFGANSYTTGVVSQHGRLLGRSIFDQVSTTAQPGSSGCGVFTREGLYMGMLVRGCPGTDTFNFITPVRVIADWAKRHSVYWLLDDTVPVLNDSVVEDYTESAPLEAAAPKDADKANYPLLINTKVRQ